MKNIITIGVLLAMVKFFILDNIHMRVVLTSEAAIVAIICSVLIFLSVIIPCLLFKGGKK